MTANQNPYNNGSSTSMQQIQLKNAQNTNNT